MQQFDPTGTRITSTRPIAVFTGHECANIPVGTTEACDHVVQQVPPQLTWGRRFFTIPVVGRYSGDHYRVATINPNTQFTVTCRTLTNPTPTTESFAITFNSVTNTGFEMFNTNIGTTSRDRTRPCYLFSHFPHASLGRPFEAYDFCEPLLNE